MNGLSRRLRAILIAVSAASYVLSLSDVSEPLDARDLGPTPAPVLHAPDRPTAPPLASYVRRDPFAGAPAFDDDVAARTAGAADAANRAGDAGGGDDDDVAVPDIVPAAAPATKPANAATPRDDDTGDAPAFTVRATIAGTRPVAYVARGADLQLVRVGDALAGRRVVSIDLRGLTLSDGARLDLVRAYLATPAPLVKRDAPARDAGGSRQPRRNAPAHERSATPLAVSPQTDAPRPPDTPGPLPTVDSRGLPVGVNPTPAPGPTAFPYPYPYPPVHK